MNSILEIIEKNFSIIFIVYLLVYAFFNGRIWMYLDKPYDKIFIFNITTVVIPCILLLIPFLLDKTKKLPLTIYDVLFLIFIAWVLGSSFYAINPGIALRGGTRWLVLFIVYYCFKWILTYQRDQVIPIIINLLSVLGIILVLHYFYNNFNKLSNLAEIKGTYDGLIKKTRSLIGLKNTTASFAFILFVAHFSFFKEKNSKSNLLHLVFYFLISFFIFLLASRNVYIGIFSFAGLYFYFISKSNFSIKKYIPKILLGVSAIVLFFSLTSYQAFISSLGSSTLKVRLRMWKLCINYLSDSPLTGIGHYQWELINYNFNKLTSPHNDHVRILLELGLVGFILFTCGYIVQLIKGKKILFSKLEQHIGLQISLIGLICFQLIGTFDTIHNRLYHGILIMLVLANIDVLLTKNKSFLNFENKLQKFQSTFKYLVFALGIGCLIYRQLYVSNYAKYQLTSEHIRHHERQKAKESISEINFNLIGEKEGFPAYAMLGRLCAKKNANKEAIYYFEKALTLFPYNELSVRELSKIYSKQNDIEKKTYYQNLLQEITKGEKGRNRNKRKK